MSVSPRMTKPMKLVLNFKVPITSAVDDKSCYNLTVFILGKIKIDISCES